MRLQDVLSFKICVQTFNLGFGLHIKLGLWLLTEFEIWAFINFRAKTQIQAAVMWDPLAGVDLHRV